MFTRRGEMCAGKSGVAPPAGGGAGPHVGGGSGPAKTGGKAFLADIVVRARQLLESAGWAVGFSVSDVLLAKHAVGVGSVKETVSLVFENGLRLTITVYDREEPGMHGKIDVDIWLPTDFICDCGER